jgi:pantoate--beta-alanine ligase
VERIAELRQTLDRHRAAGRSVGFIPTMGYLHDGHASLMRRAAATDDVVVASIFVNPLQFSPTEDLAGYPRDLDGDTGVAAAAGVDLLFVPPTIEMYPADGVLTTVAVAELSARWEGGSRPTHFAGVCTVVSKLLNIVGPCRVYFGEKDFQQLAVIRRMVGDLSMPVEVVGCPIVREPDGLALSSRNLRLDPAQRRLAPELHRTLRGAADPAGARRELERLGFAVDYVEDWDGRRLAAACLGDVRLIDNVPLG